ncbi:MAG: MFS transporter [Opitutus sp.]
MIAATVQSSDAPIGDLQTAQRKVTRRLLPGLMALYIIAFIDRVNLGYAKHDFLRDAHFSEAVYAFGAGVFFIGYALFEVPSNMAMVRVGARRWFCRIMVSWGLVSAAMVFADTARVFYSLRFLLGAAEAGFFPGVIFYLTRWYPAKRRGAAMGLFYFGVPLAQIGGGPLSGWLLELDGTRGLAGWQWMFVVEGLMAVVAGILVLRYLPDRPADARWLTRPEQQALEDAARATASTSPIRHAWTEFRSRRMVMFGATYLLIQASVYGVTFYLPTQVALLLGRKAGLVVGLVSAIPWLAALAAAYTLPRLAARVGHGARVGAAALMFAAAGIAFSANASGPIGLAAMCIATAGFIGCQPIFWTYPTSVLTAANAAAGIALINSCGAIGGFIAPNLRAFLERHFASEHAGVAGLASLSVVAALLFWWFDRLRRNDDAEPSSERDR